MPRIRTIKPDFFTSKTLASVSRVSRLTFIGLWTLCDDLGVYQDIPKKIAGELYPFEDVTGAEIDNQLNELVDAGLLFRVSENGKDFIIISSWDEHQKIDRPSNPHYFKRETRDSLASVHRTGSRSKEVGSRSKEVGSRSKDLKTLSEKNSDERKNTDSNAEKTDSLDGSEPEIVKQVTEKEIPDAKPDANRDNSAKKNDYPDEFEAAWKLYPKRSGDNPKNLAFKQWKIRLKEGDTVEQMTDGIARYAKFCVATGKVGTEAVKHAQTFLGLQKSYKESWELPVNVPRVNGSQAPPLASMGYLTAEEKRRIGTANARAEFLASFRTIEGEVVK
jgi:hypothetical protein